VTHCSGCVYYTSLRNRPKRLANVALSNSHRQASGGPKGQGTDLVHDSRDMDKWGKLLNLEMTMLVDSLVIFRYGFFAQASRRNARASEGG